MGCHQNQGRRGLWPQAPLHRLLLPKAPGLGETPERKPGPPHAGDHVPRTPYLLGSSARSPFSLVTMTL